MIMNNPQSNLPPGFRFHPTDEELILHYLKKKLSSTPFPVSIIADVDIYKFDPWDLPARAAFGEKEWYFFSPRDRKYPNGARPNRAAASGYWKATGTDKVIMTSSVAVAGGGMLENIGVKKALVFYKGRPPKGVKTNWIMHEYRLTDASANNKPVKTKDSSMRLDDWVLCRIYKKSHASPATPLTASDQEEEEEQFIPETILPGLTSSPPINNTLKPQKSCSFSNLLDAMDYSLLSSFLSDFQGSETGVFEFPPQPPNQDTADQPLFNNYTTSGCHVQQKQLPHLSSSPPIVDQTRLKRQNPNIDEEIPSNPSKKMTNSCSFSNSINQNDVPQYSFLNQSFLNQQLLLSPHLQFQG